MQRSRTLLILMFVGIFALTGHAAAAEIVVDTKTDQAYGPGPECSLRNAIIAADRNMRVAGCAAGSDEDLDRVLLPLPGTYVLTVGSRGDDDPASGDLDLRADNWTLVESLTGGTVTIDGGGLDRIFDIDTTSPYASLALRGVQLTGGDPGPDADGGAIRLGLGSLGLRRVSVFSNVARDGAGISVRKGLASVKNSTIGFNRADRRGGGFDIGLKYSWAEFKNVTIARNVADADRDGDGGGGGMAIGEKAMVDLTDSILADNHVLGGAAGRRGGDCLSEGSFRPMNAVLSQGPSKACPFFTFAPSYETNRYPVDPRLGEFGLHDGPTSTFPIGPGSPAIGAGAVFWPNRCMETDQRGVERPSEICDAGAYQYSRLGTGYLPPVDRPTDDVAVLAGGRVSVKLRCPRKVKSACHTKASVVIYPNVVNRMMSGPKKLTIPPGGSRVVRFRIRKEFRSRVEAMAQIDRRRLYVRQWIHARRMGRKGKPGNDVHFGFYKVRRATSGT